MAAVWVIGLYGIVTFVGGVIGFIKASSRASLIAGGVSGVLLLACAYGMAQGVFAAKAVGAVLSVLLGLRFGMVWYKKRRLMPDLVMVGFSFAALVVLFLEWRQ